MISFHHAAARVIMLLASILSNMTKAVVLYHVDHVMIRGIQNVIMLDLVQLYLPLKIR